MRLRQEIGTLHFDLRKRSERNAKRLYDFVVLVDEMQVQAQRLVSARSGNTFETFESR